ncbi:hypothetical protein O6H91_01G016200 [Diphasiastrum complanatum]|uniref:Uncharacterized protein n=1 Tax=Diphasiastrum complanatum TaxID=34168 RepID=A0ACC2ENM7_DIPCM|nr:hypothetical protein O6H91_01G016200 [Diphasiastrum complanatum]
MQNCKTSTYTDESGVEAYPVILMEKVSAPSLNNTSAQTGSSQNENLHAGDQETTGCSNSPVILVDPYIKPPPLPPRENLRIGKRLSSSSATVKRKTCIGEHVPKETVEIWDKLFDEGLDADTSVLTQDGGIISAHASILAVSSPVLRNLLLEQPLRKCRRCISILGVPHSAALAFIRFLYSSRFKQEDMDQHVLHLLVLSHVYAIPALKRLCISMLEDRLLTADNVIDVLQLARLCDAPRLSIFCLRLIVKDFKAVAKSEGWRAMRTSNQALEQELLGVVIESDSRKQEKQRKAEEEKVYKQLYDAMEALLHICKDGCRTIGPHDKVLDGTKQGPCKFPACKGLESLVRHFAGCKMKVAGGCIHCKRMWQLLELHSCMCQDTDCCKVPLCRHFKERTRQQTKKEENRWKLLVSKVLAAKGSSDVFSLSAVSAKLEEQT